jgi:hypothetical protein
MIKPTGPESSRLCGDTEYSPKFEVDTLWYYPYITGAMPTSWTRKAKQGMIHEP